MIITTLIAMNMSTTITITVMLTIIMTMITNITTTTGRAPPTHMPLV